MTQERVRKASTTVVVQAPYSAKETVAKATTAAVVQRRQQIDVSKAVAYAVEMPRPAIQSLKTIAYLVEAEITGTIPTADMCKAVAYLVEGKIPKAEAFKVLGYAYEGPDTSGNAFQDATLEKPLYRTGTLPYVEFITGSSLKINSLFGGIHTLVIYTQAGEFDIHQITLAAGENTLPTVNFNQCVVVRGVAPRVLIESIKATILDRATP